MRSVIRENQVSDSEFVSPQEHEGLHDKDLYTEISRVLGKVYKIEEWRDITKTFKVSSTAFIRSGKQVSQTIKSIYDYETGTTVIATVTGTTTRHLGNIVSVEYTRDFDTEGV